MAVTLSPFHNIESNASRIASTIMQNKNGRCSDKFDTLHHGTPFSFRLTAHSSCVNALVWSGNGRWLATAGDDTKVALWDFHPTEPSLAVPNIYSGSLTITVLSVLSSGSVDGRILQYDISRPPSTLAVTPRSGLNVDDEGCLRAIAPSPSQDDIFLAASEDGFVTAYDTRVPSLSLPRPRGVGRLSLDSEATGVQIHPIMESIFVTSDNRGKCRLWDTRTAFSSDQKQSKRSLLQYVTKITKPGRLKLSSPEASSVTFDATGRNLAVTMLNFLPTIYDLRDEWPIAVCSAAPTTNKPKRTSSAEESSKKPSQVSDPLEQCLSERSYVNTCTIKHGSFGSPGRQKELYYGAGSDDFCGYVWRIPDGVSDFRQKINYSDWAAGPHGNSDVVGFAKSVTGHRIVPRVLDKPQFLIYGHKSIVNTVLFHPFEPYIATAGIERHVLIHSSFATTPICQNLTRTKTSVRRIPDNSCAPRRQSDSGTSSSSFSNSQQIEQSDRAAPESDDEFSDSDEAATIKYFDEILIHEGPRRIFVARDTFDALRIASSEDSGLEDESYETDS